MKQQLAFRVLADDVMKWTDEKASGEFAWLTLISRIKYDGYQGYLAGVRFVESLITWLQQFREADRETAYALVRSRLIYIGTPEMRHLVERLFFREVQPRLVEAAAKEFGLPHYRVWAETRAAEWVSNILRRTLFMGLSDGARMDVLRRVNASRISNEQTVLAPVVDHDKWKDLQGELRKDLPGNDIDPKFAYLYVIDDLTASGTTLIRYDQETGKWKGKLPKLRDAIWAARKQLGDDFPLAPDCILCVHHYIATEAALRDASALCAQAASEYSSKEWFSAVHLSAGMTLRDELKLKLPEDDFVRLTNDYYDPVLENKHAAASGIKNMRIGYKECSLPLILEHNTPNNSISLLWAETEGRNGSHAMRPLFRRASRHS